MTNESKAKERAMQVFPCPNESEQRRIVELAYNDACNWKDQQFKEYLEKKREEIVSARGRCPFSRGRIRTSDGDVLMDDALRAYTFADGTPFGKLIEE